MTAKPFRRIEEMDLYEVLDVGREASEEEIVEAYRKAMDAYRPGSLTSYGLIGDEERRTLLERLDLAYRTLSDEEARRAYDEATFGGTEAPGPRAAFRRTVERLEIGDADRRPGFLGRLRRLFRVFRRC